MTEPTPPPDLVRFGWVSLAAGITTLTLKALAFWLTGSVGLLSDAVESIVNVVAAIVAIWVLRVAAAPPDEEHEHGHHKAEYFSSGLEGALIVVAAFSIIASAVPRLITPRPLEAVTLGLGVSAGASLVNLGVGLKLLRTGRRVRSITLEADGHHLLTDVWTSAGVIVGVAATYLTGWLILDPLLAIAVALQILRTGWKLLHRSGMGLLDTSVSPEDRAAIVAVLDRYQAEGARWHALRTRLAGPRRFVSVHVLVPGDWTVKRGHDLLERLESDIRATSPMTTVITHLEPLEDEAAYTDLSL